MSFELNNLEEQIKKITLEELTTLKDDLWDKYERVKAIIKFKIDMDGVLHREKERKEQLAKQSHNE